MSFLSKKYRTLNQVLISESALRQNLALYRKLLPNKAICPVLKSNAYGHGLTLTAKILEKEQPEFFIVDSLYEAYELKKARIKSPILILGYNFKENLRRRLPFHFTASDLESLKNLAELRLPIHLEINTGMNRMGLVWDQLEELLDTLQIHKIYPEGIFTHLSSADEAQNDFTELQLERFLKVVTALKAIGREPRWVHVANSAGALKAKHPEINMVRLGLGLYGLNPYEEEDHFFKKLDSLKPVLEFKSTLVGIQKIKKGERSGYGTHYKAPKDQTIGIIAAGYYEGIPIKLSNTGLAEVHGKRCPFIGRVCMNHTMILLEDVEAKIGDPVLVYSRDKSSPLCVFEQSKRAQAFHYEMITRLSQSVRRQAVQ